MATILTILSGMDNPGFVPGQIVGALLVGLIIGAIVLVLGIKKKQVVVGGIGFAVCLIGGFIRGLMIDLPLLIIFICIINVRAKKMNNEANSESNNESNSENE